MRSPGRVLFWIASVVVQPLAAASDLSSGWTDVIQQNKNSTVLLRIEQAGKAPGYGSGVIIDAAGRLLTAKHVLPDSNSRTNGTFLITALVGWDSPSVDFSQASKVDIEYVSESSDLAVLRFRSKPTAAGYVFVEDDVHQGQALLVMGYPSGANLAVTAGLVSQPAADGEYATDAVVGVGDSGGPIFSSSGGLLGILLEGTRRTEDGQIALGYFLSSHRILDEFSSHYLKAQLARAPFEKPKQQLQELIQNFSVDDDKTDHPGLTATTKSFEHTFEAQAGFRIVEASFEPSSANHVVGEPTVTVIDGGSRVLIRFALESGPIFDQWRGWLVGKLVTKQIRR